MHIPRLIQFLALYMVVAAIFGSYRTGSYIPLLILGSIGLVTLFLGLMTTKGGETLRKVTLGWLSLNILVEGYQAFWRLPAHPDARPGSSFLFGSIALFSLVVLAAMILKHNRKS